MTIQETIKKAVEGGYNKNDKKTYYWEVKWHNFIDYLSEGKTAEEFFKQF